MPTLPQKPTIAVDGNLSDWTATERIATTDPVIGASTTIWLNTDQKTATGTSPFGSIGAEYNITHVSGAFYLYTSAAAQTLVSPTPLTTGLSSDGKGLAIAIPRSLVTRRPGLPRQASRSRVKSVAARRLPSDQTITTTPNT